MDDLLEEYSKITLGLQNCPSTIVLDGRGTLIDPVIDEPISRSLASNLNCCQHKGVNFVLITGCSIQTINALVLPFLREDRYTFGKSSNGNNPGSIVIYTGTGSQGYRLDVDGCLQPLPGYRHLALDDKTIESILDAVNKSCKKLKMHGYPEFRQHQINFYCDYNRQNRQALSEEIKYQLALSGLDDLIVVVPTAKMVIDISLSSKRQAFLDYQIRFGVVDFTQVLLISDSLQVDGSDVELFLCMPGAKAFHVGPLDKPLFQGVIGLNGGTKSTEMILASVFNRISKEFS